ncbi:MAG TPA: LytTR family DNA-binding domain-containing protein [Haliscomenobacter sp.]|uniref:LytR/AlgR family response regulator transcription factor n=1 Tax=Haliscomenobacter sp. TaxID=2717303 RepID=UPI002CE29432|nr:LytTR family DNA-binding domain-containing protein [Haliscomenobacter sp.]HOY17952.1 LytTR family DNA-binding domain-containing protein [Haliscomenobacter sp.]HPH21223.1 LytTR family DNA-binding domain-containing protein [Haliscomenobacter sp.]
MKLVAIAIDDEPKALEVVQMHAAKVPFLELQASFIDAFEALPFLRQHKVDLIFLDIKMPDISGIEFAQILKNGPLVVFTTAYSEYAVQGFDLDAVDYLLKPFSLARFTKACNKALEMKNVRTNEVPEFIFLKTGYEEEKVYLKDILYIEAAGNYMTYVLKERKLMCRQNVPEALQTLPEQDFVRVHRSFIVGVQHVGKIARQQIWVNGVEIPVGASYEDSVGLIKERLNA